MTGPDQYVQRAELGWQRLHPLSPVVRSARVGFALVVVSIGDLSRKSGSKVGLYVDLGVLLFALLTSFVAWLVTRWRIENGVLRIEGGLIRRTSRRFPAEQIQAVDTVSPAIARVFGLSEVRLRMAASSKSSGKLSYLTEADAHAVKSRLLALAHGVSEHAPAPPEQVLYRIPTGRLVASILLSRPGLVAEGLVGGVIALAVLAPSALPAIISLGFTAFVIVFTNIWRRFNGEYELTLAEAPDGLRIRSGLLQTATETIPKGRIQAVRMTEPLLWRPFGWCRVVVDVAGKQRRNRENQDMSGALRAVLPVGGRDQAAWLVKRLLPGAPPPGDHTGNPAPFGRPPARSRFKSPLRYRYLSWTCNDLYAVTTSGRVRRATDWVPLAKVQSIRQIEGPVQRRLALATVHLDTAGRNVHAIARDRDVAESANLMASLPATCRQARASGERLRS